LQTIIQARRLKSIESNTSRMNESPVPDGGSDDHSEVGTTGGGALSGAIADGALGSSFGIQGTLSGAFLGAILGDVFEERMLIGSCVEIFEAI
jgi:outer membrane lipoprotein SlyB